MHVAAGESGLYAFLVADQPLEPETEYTIQIQGVRDLSGNLLPSTVTSTFTTGTAPDTTPPSVISTNPANGAIDVLLDVTPEGAFDESLDPATVDSTTVTLSTGGTAVPGTVTYADASHSIRVAPTEPLTPATIYTVLLRSGIKDLAGNTMLSDVSWSFTTVAQATVTALSVSPRGASISVGSTQQFVATATYSDTTTRDVTSEAVWSSSNTAVATVAAGLATGQGPGLATITATFGGLSAEGGVQVADGTPLPIVPSWIAPTLDRTVVTALGDSAEFLHTGADPIQTGVSSGTIEDRRAAVLRGSVFGRDGNPLPGVTVAIAGHAELGSTRTRADGAFDMVVNGGGPLTVRYEMTGYLRSDRQVDVPWKDFVQLPDVVLVAYDTQVTVVDLQSPAAVQVARGSAVTDADGTRQATVLFPAATTATFELADGTTLPAGTVHVRATEFTVGARGPSAMPAELPPSSAYTYAVDLSVDEAVAIGARNVRFSLPIPVYVENFLDFPVGEVVPAGYYDSGEHAWVPSQNGRIVKILAINGSLVDLDIDGTNTPAAPEVLASLGISSAELERLATLYEAGQSFWRVPVDHFSPWDYNWPVRLSPGAQPPYTRRPGVETDTRDRDCLPGSIIECQSRTLGEQIPLQGTTVSLHYRSSRVAGATAAYTAAIQLTGEQVPPGVKSVVLTVDVAGTRFITSFAPQPNLSYTYTWDGRDAFGRTVQGAVPAVVEIGYTYDAEYAPPGSDGPIVFGLRPDITTALGQSRTDAVLTQTHEVVLGTWDATPLGNGGWTLSNQHTLDATTGRLYLGNGTWRGGALELVRSTVAGGGPEGNGNGDGGPATSAYIETADAVVVGPDGSIYISEDAWWSDSVLRKVDPSGTITTIATGLGRVTAVGPDGSLYGASFWAKRVFRRAPDGSVTTIAGTGTRGYSGDGGPATLAELDSPTTVALGRDGSIYIGDWLGCRVRRVDPSGMISTFAGTGSCEPSEADDAPAETVPVMEPLSVAVGPDGSVYIAEYERLRRVTPDGIIRTITGILWQETPSADGIPARGATACSPQHLAVARDGRIYFADWCSYRVRMITTDGILHTVAGGEPPPYWGYETVDGPAGSPIRSPYSVALGPDDTLFFAEAYGQRVFSIRPAVSNGGQAVVASEDGLESYVFNAEGRHLRTIDARTGATTQTFAYEDGYLTSITDRDGNLTRLERTGGRLTAVVAPGGQRTVVEMDANGFLSRVRRPDGQSWRIISSSDGLITSFSDLNGGDHPITYDANGFLQNDSDPAGGGWTLTRTGGAGDQTSTITSAEGRTNTYRLQQVWGESRRTNTDAAGLISSSVERLDGTAVDTSPDGTVTTTALSADPRWKMQAPFVSNLTIRLPSGLTSATSTSRDVVLTNPADPTTLQSQTDTTTVNGRTWVTSFDGATRTETVRSPLGRQQSRVLDAKGRVQSVSQAGLTPVTFGYDPQGRLATVTLGTRQTTIAYDTENRPVTLVDPLQKTTTFGYDAADRITSQTLPDLRVIGFGYDPNGNTTQVVPPGRPAHGFTYTPVDLTQTYTPPTVPGGGPTSYAYNRDRQLTRVDRPGGDQVALGYDTGGRLSTMTFDAGTLAFTYHPTGQVETITAPNEALSFTFDGPLPLTSAWTGAVSGVVGQTYSTDFAVATQRVNDVALSFGYDDDGLLTQAGALTLARHPDHGSVTGTTLGGVTDQYDWTGYGEPSRYQAHHAAFGSYPVFDAHYTRDDAGRITQIIETVDTIQRVWTYTYDDAGRLTTVRRNGDVAASYTYDSNSNRLIYDGDRGHEEGTYDDQDRLVTYAGASYTYAPNGELATKTAGAQVTHYTYDALGNLRSVGQPDGTLIEYVIDGRNRRLGKKVNGVLVKGWLYADQLRIVAELDGTGAVVSRFVYGSKANVPDYMVRDGVLYRIISDHLGSPRVVLSAETGQVVQRLDFDPFGVVRQDSNPGWQPFGFAGGLYDSDTKLLRFGVRDYDAETGRWTARDPIAFLGEDSNLYGYALNAPLDNADPTGLRCKSYLERALDNFKQTNDFLPGLLAPTGLGLTFGIPGATADVAEGTTFLRWAANGFRGMVLGGANFTALETGIIAAANGSLAYALTATAFEAGVTIGSLINAGLVPCKDNCK